MKCSAMTKHLMALVIALGLCVSLIPGRAFAAQPAWQDVDPKYDIYQRITIPAEGDVVVLYNPGNGKLLSSQVSGICQLGREPEVVGEDYLASESDTVGWTVSLDNGVYTFTQGELTLGMEASGSYVNLKPNGPDCGFALKAFQGGGDLYQIYSASLESSYGHAYISWYAPGDGFSAYSIGEKWVTEADFGFRFYRLVRAGESQQEPEIPTEPSKPEVAVEPVVFCPDGGELFMEGESKEILLSTATEDAVIYYATASDGVTFGDFREYIGPILIPKGFGRLTIQAYAEKEGCIPSTPVTRTFTERLSARYQLFFGQLHAHTDISDGSGTVEEAFRYASQVEGLDFLAVTDHSNSFDGAELGVLAKDGSAISDEWKLGHEMADAYTGEDFVGLYGFEMTWPNGLGHINTFNTPGWQNCHQEAYKYPATALQNYYEALATVPGSISQFNHPGTIYGDFEDFGHYSEDADARITLIEVGSGEGAIGASGYFPAYEYYTRALDKGWHLAPTNNQNNHRGLWGDANTGRTVILAESLTREEIYDALRSYRVYATEDRDLNIHYTLNGYIMGSQLNRADLEEDLTVSVTALDLTDGEVGRVEVIVDGGAVAASRSLQEKSGNVTMTVPADYSYYYIRITQPDGDTAVTAPVWVNHGDAVGISVLRSESPLTIAGREQIFTAEIFNNHREELLVESLVFTDRATGAVLYTETGIPSLAGKSTAEVSFGYTFPTDGIPTITATLKGTLRGVPQVCTRDLEVTVMPETITADIIVDGTHFPDFGENLNNMAAIAAAQGLRVHVEKDAITPEMLENCTLLVIAAPASGSDEVFSEEFTHMVAQYVQNGGSVILCGRADRQDSATYHAADQLNQLLCAMESTMRFQDDLAQDDVRNGGQSDRLYLKNFNLNSPWCAGLMENQEYRQFSGCTVDPGEGTWLIKGFETTYSVDSDGDGLGGAAKGEAVFLAVEETGFGGHLFVSGGAFLSDSEIRLELNNIWDLPYANRTIYENILGIARALPQVTPIAEVRASAAEDPGRIFMIEGYITAGTANPSTKFLDTIYLQDETGGIAALPYTEVGLELGTKVRITGHTDIFQGDIRFKILHLEILDVPKCVREPEKVSNTEAMDYPSKGGELLQVEGEVVAVTLTADGRGVSQFLVLDPSGHLATVLVEDNIRSGTTGENTLADRVKVGNTVSAVGLLYMVSEGSNAVLRVRDCDEVVLIQEKPLVTEPDRTQLEEAIRRAREKKQSLYSRKSWNALQEALKEAEAVLADENATQEEIFTAADALNAAIRALAPLTGRNPETGDASQVELHLAIMFGSLVALAVLLWNRKRFLV